MASGKWLTGDEMSPDGEIMKKQIRIRKITTARGISYQEIKYVTSAEGYVMARNKGCIPFVLSIKEWNALPIKTFDKPNDKHDKKDA